MKVEAKVDDLPFNAFPLVLLLLQNEHVVVEELLQTFVRVVNAQLLKLVQLSQKYDVIKRKLLSQTEVTSLISVNLKYLEASNVKDAEEVVMFSVRLQCSIDSSNQPLEHPDVHCLAHCVYSKAHLLLCLTFRHVFTADLDLGLKQRSNKVICFDAKQVRCFFCLCEGILPS